MQTKKLPAPFTYNYKKKMKKLVLKTNLTKNKTFTFITSPTVQFPKFV